MKPADTTTIANLPGPPSDLLADLLTNPPGDVEADAEARKVHAADAAKAWRWILIRLRPEMSDDEVRGLVLSVLQEKQPQLAVEAGVVGRLTAAALRQNHSGSQPPPKPGPKPNPKPGIAQRALSSIARIPAKQIGMAGLAFVALMLIIDPIMTAFVVAVTAPFVAMFAILRAFRGGDSGGCSGGSCGV
jgi:hypothetical protein